MSEQHQRIPAEFVGKARAFRAEVGRETKVFVPAFHDIVRPLRQRVRTHPVLRRDLIAAAARQWRELPQQFCFSSEVTTDPRRFQMTQTRLDTSSQRLPDWNHNGELEPGVIVLRTVVVFERNRLPTGGIEVRLPVLQTWLACISAHALARYFQRARDSSHAALLADLHALAQGTIEADVTEVAAPCGIWLGSVIATKHANVAGSWVDSPFFARTFLSHDDRADTDGRLIP